MHHPFPLSYCGGWWLWWAEMHNFKWWAGSLPRFRAEFEIGSNPHTRATGTGFSGVQKSVPRPIPLVNPWQNPQVLKTHDILYWPLPWPPLLSGPLQRRLRWWISLLTTRLKPATAAISKRQLFNGLWPALLISMSVGPQKLSRAAKTSGPQSVFKSFQCHSLFPLMKVLFSSRNSIRWSKPSRRSLDGCGMMRQGQVSLRIQPPLGRTMSSTTPRPNPFAIKGGLTLTKFPFSCLRWLSELMFIIRPGLRRRILAAQPLPSQMDHQ